MWISIFHSGLSLKRKSFHIRVVICTLAGLLSGLAFGAPETGNSEQEESARQLRIYRDSLLQGSTEEIRVDAAVGLLLRNDDASRDALVAVLSEADNPIAQQAVCKALIKSRGLGQTIRSRMIYLDPLMEILASDNAEGAVLAAEALLLYSYRDIEEALETILQAEEASHQARLNIVYALQIRSERQSLTKLVALLDDTDSEVAKAAENALQEAFGIPVGASRKVWDDILEKLKRKSPDDIRREMLLLKETRLREMQAERDRWQKLYLGAIDKQYEALDEAGQGKMILEMLSGDLAPIRVWALEKVTQYPPADQEVLREKLLALLADASRDVRLQAAKVLNSMSALDPAQALLTQFKLEEDSAVRLALFEALGEACFFAFSPGSPVKLSPEIKAETLSIAAQFLASEQADASLKGAEVIRKILELNSLPKESIQSNLILLADRYKMSIDQNGTLRADLLNVLGHLCVQGSSRVQACRLYAGFFRDAITEDDPALRLAALKGLISVDPVEAMRIVREYQLIDDESPAVRQEVIDLASQMGGEQEMASLMAMLNANGQGEEAWQAIKSICQRQKSTFLLLHAGLLETEGRAEYVREILELAEQKAIGEKNNDNLPHARQRLISWYRQRKQWDAGAEYLEKIGYSEIGRSLRGSAVDAFAIYLYSGRVSDMAQVIENSLLKSDFIENNPFLELLSGFLLDESVTDEAKLAVYEKLLAIDVQKRPVWDQFKSDLSILYHALLSAQPLDTVVAEEASTTELPVLGQEN